MRVFLIFINVGHEFKIMIINTCKPILRWALAWRAGGPQLLYQRASLTPPRGRRGQAGQGLALVTEQEAWCPSGFIRTLCFVLLDAKVQHCGRQNYLPCPPQKKIPHPNPRDCEAATLFLYRDFTAVIQVTNQLTSKE